MDEKQGLRAGRYVGSASTTRSPIRTRSRSKQQQQAESARREEASSKESDDAPQAIRAKSRDDVVAVTSEPSAAAVVAPLPCPPIAPAAPRSLPQEKTKAAPMEQEEKQKEEEEEANTTVVAAAPAVAPTSSPPPPPAPTAKEIAAAEAAKQRLYGGEVAQAPSSTILPSGPPPPTVDVPLRATSELEPLLAGMNDDGKTPSISDALSSAVASLDPRSDWSDVARGLDTLRRGVKHHRSEALAVLPSAIPGIVSAVFSLRSALCRAGIAAASDVSAAFGAEEPWVVVGGRRNGDRERNTISTTCLLPCLLSKAASNDKKFIVDAASSALVLAASSVPAEVLAPRLLEVLVPASEEAKSSNNSTTTAAVPPPLASLPRGRAAATRALAHVFAKVASDASKSSSAAQNDLAWLMRAAEETTTTSTSSSSSSLFAKLSAVASDLSRDAWPPARQAARDLQESLKRIVGGGSGAGGDGGKENVVSRLPPLPTYAAFAKAMPSGAADVVVLPAPTSAPKEQQQAHGP